MNDNPKPDNEISSQNPDAQSSEEEPLSGEQPVETEVTSSSEKKVPPVLNESVSKPVKSGRGIAWCSLFVALTAGGGAGYTWWSLQSVQSTIANDDSNQELEARLNSQTETLRTEIGGTERSLQQFRSQMSKQSQSMQELNSRLNNLNRRIQEVTKVDRDSWIVAEVEYLLRLANQRLSLEQEPDSARAILEAADEILASLQLAQFYDVRSALVKEITALRTLGKRDIAGIFLQISAIAGEAEKLTLLEPNMEITAAAEPSSAKTISERVNEAFSRFVSMIEIRRRDEPVAPLLSPKEYFYIKQNLRLMFEQAQLALLKREPALYTQSLEQAKSWLKDYFQLNNAALALIDQVNAVQDFEVAPEIPDISESLRLLKRALELSSSTSRGADDVLPKQTMEDQRPVAIL